MYHKPMDIYLIESINRHHNDPHSKYPANRVSGGGGKGKEKPRGVPGTVELLQSRIIAPQVEERGCMGGVSFVCVCLWVQSSQACVGRSVDPSIRLPTHPPPYTKTAGGGLRLAPAAGGVVRAQRPRPDPAHLHCHQAAVLLIGRGACNHTHRVRGNVNNSNGCVMAKQEEEEGENK